MSKITIVLIQVLVISSLCSNLIGKELFGVDTGRFKSASWMFVEELSSVWHVKYRDKASQFSPQHVESIYQRFVNLDKKDCRFVIAPLKSVTELPISDLNIKIVLILWESYLAPLSSIEERKPVGLSSHKVWYLPEYTKLIPGFLKSLEDSYLDLSSDMDPDLIKFAELTIWDHPNSFTYYESDDI